MSVTRRLRRYLLTGLVVLAPVGLTVFILVWTFRGLDGILGRHLQNAIGFRVPGLGFLALALALLVIGWAVQQAAGRQLLHWWNEALVRFPLTGRIYNAASQIVQSVVGQRNRIFGQAVLIPYPTEGMWALAFITKDSSPLSAELLGEPCVHVFIPTTPNPTSGFMLIVPVSKIRVPDMTVEEAMKMIISAGAVVPTSRVEGKPIRGLDLEHLLRDTSEFHAE